MVETRKDKENEVNCDSCSLKADIIQYCLDNEIGPFNKFSLRNIYHDREVNLTAYLSFLQITIVVAFAIATLILSHALYQNLSTIVTFIAIILIVSGLTHYILAHSNKIIKRNDVNGAFYLPYRCISDEHESVLLTSADSLFHMLKGDSHKVKQLKFNIYTSTHFRSSFDYFLFILIVLWILLPAHLLIRSELLSLALGIDVFATLVALILLRFIPNRKKDVNLVQFSTIKCHGNIYFMFILLYIVSSYTFRKFTRHLDVSKLCYVPVESERHRRKHTPFESDKDRRIYIIESFSESFTTGVKKIKFLEGNKEIKVEDFQKLVSKRSLAKWRDIFEK